jgi:flagellar basal body rod protein FlgG
MTYIDPHTHKRFKETNKKTEVDIITDKKQWVVIDNKGKLVYHRDGHFLIFSNKRIALAWFRENDKLLKNTSWRLEKLTVCITRE